MNAELLDILNKVENFSGANASIEIPISRELANRILEKLRIPKINSISIDEISNNGVKLFIGTAIPFHHKNRIELQIFPEVKLPEMELTAIITSGLNKIQIFILTQLVDEKLTFKGNKITINIRILMPPESKLINYLPLLKTLKIKTSQDKILLYANLKIQ